MFHKRETEKKKKKLNQNENRIINIKKQRRMMLCRNLKFCFCERLHSRTRTCWCLIFISLCMWIVNTKNAIRNEQKRNNQMSMYHGFTISIYVSTELILVYDIIRIPTTSVLCRSAHIIYVCILYATNIRAHKTYSTTISTLFALYTNNI